MTQTRIVQIPALTGIRIIAAAWVVVEHFRNVVYGLLPDARSAHVLIDGGYLGVEVFFVLSGFIISHNYADSFATFGARAYGKFLRNRLAKLYPVHVVTLAFVGMLVAWAALFHISLTSDGKYDPIGFVMNLLLLQAIPPAQAWNGPAWSISAEAGAYVLFPLAALLIGRVRSRFGLVLGAAAALAFTGACEFLLQATLGFDPTEYASIWVRILGEFVAGCFIWALWRKLESSGRKFDMLAATGAVGVVLVLALSNGLSAANFLVLPFVALFIFGCAAATGPIRRFLASRAMQYGGRISYSLYMTHFIVLMIGGKLLPWEHFAGASVYVRAGVVVAYFVAAFAVAALAYRFVEEPGRKWLAGRRSASRIAAAPIVEGDRGLVR